MHTPARTMSGHQNLPSTVYGIRVNHFAPHLQARVEHVIAVSLAVADGDRVAVEVVDGTDVLCFFVEEWKVRSVVTGLAALGMISEPVDLSHPILLGRSCGPVFDAVLARYRGLVESFRRQHLTVNDVLDKIGAYGIGSLDAVDREVLGVGR